MREKFDPNASYDDELLNKYISLYYEVIEEKLQVAHNSHSSPEEIETMRSTLEKKMIEDYRKKVTFTLKRFVIENATNFYKSFFS